MTPFIDQIVGISVIVKTAYRKGEFMILNNLQKETLDIPISLVFFMPLIAFLPNFLSA